MLYENDGRLDEHEYSLRCLALRSFPFLKKTSSYSFLSPAPLLPIPINPVCQVLIYIMVHMVMSAFPKGTVLRLVSHFYDDDLFQTFHNPFVLSCGTKCYTDTVKL